ncbi:hypothetical protein PSPO01_07733 [Paraphaeosphaeria sporulosa]
MTLSVAAATMNVISIFAYRPNRAPTISGITSRSPDCTLPETPHPPSPVRTLPPPPYYTVPQPPSYMSQFPHVPRPPYEALQLSQQGESPRALESQIVYERPRHSALRKFWRYVGTPICWLSIVLVVGGFFVSMCLIFLWPKARGEQTEA